MFKWSRLVISSLVFTTSMLAMTHSYAADDEATKTPSKAKKEVGTANLGKIAPDWTLRQGEEGSLSLQEILDSNDAVVMMFWAKWCPLCKKLFPGMEKIHNEYQDKKVKVVAIDFTDQGNTEYFVRRFGHTFDVVWNGQATAKDYDVSRTPTVFVVDGEGNITFRTNNYDPKAVKIREALDSVLSSTVASAAGK